MEREGGHYGLIEFSFSLIFGLALDRLHGLFNYITCIYCSAGL